MVILGLRTADWGLRGALVIALLGSAGCKAEDPPSEWEIIRGTAALAASKSLHPDSGTTMGNFPTRTGSLTVAEDSTVTGWIKMAAGDTVHITAGVVVNESGLVMNLPGLDPSEYEVITSGDYPDTYALLSTAAVTGGDVPGLHLVYWEFNQ